MFGTERCKLAREKWNVKAEKAFDCWIVASRVSCSLFETNKSLLLSEKDVPHWPLIGGGHVCGVKDGEKLPRKWKGKSIFCMKAVMSKW